MAQLIILINILIKYVKMEKISFELRGRVYFLDESMREVIVYIGENRVVKSVLISEAALNSLQYSSGHQYKRNKDDVPELYYTSPQSGVLLPLEIGSKIVSFQFVLW